jgi:hypothetical protein
MSSAILRRGLLGQAVVAGLSAAAAAQTVGKLKGFPTADAAADALTDAVRRHDAKAVQAILGESWVDFVLDDKDDEGRERAAYLAAWDARHSVTVAEDNRARIAVGTDDWTFPIPIVKDGSEWRFDSAGGDREVQARQVGHDELGAIQTLLAIVDAQYEYAAADPMKTGWPQYARRLLSSPGRKDGLYWPVGPDERPSPLGEVLANSQFDGTDPGSQFGYNFRLLYAQGPAARGGAHDYFVDGRLIGGFGAVATPLEYGVTGVMTFIVSFHGVVYEQDLGPNTVEAAGKIATFDPDKGRKKADATPP